jgi:Domain of unknown function DUF29
VGTATVKRRDADKPDVFSDVTGVSEDQSQAFIHRGTQVVAILEKSRIEFFSFTLDLSGFSPSRVEVSGDLTVERATSEPGATPEARTGVNRMATALYDTDFDAWAAEQANALARGAWHELDLEHLIEEVEDLPQTGRTIVRSQLCILVAHLLKLKYQPQRAGESWRTSVRNARVEIAAHIENRPSLRRELPDLLARAYPEARRLAIKETGLSPRTFPTRSEWSPDQLLDEDFWT